MVVEETGGKKRRERGAESGAKGVREPSPGSRDEDEGAGVNVVVGVGCDSTPTLVVPLPAPSLAPRVRK